MLEQNLSKTFVFYVVPDLTMLAFTSVIEALRLANAVKGKEVYKWRIVTADGRPVRASCGLSVSPDGAVSEERSRLRSDRADMIVVCAGWNVEQAVVKSVAGWLRESRAAGVELAAICTGAFILANAGLLEDKRCTVHWENLPVFRERFPTANVSHGLIEHDDYIHTCAGGTACFDMMVHLIAQHLGKRVAAAVCEQAIVQRVREPWERQRNILGTLGSVNPSVFAAIQFMEDNIAEQLDIDTVARHINLSRRQMERLFAKELDTSPSRFFLELRLERARLMVLQSSMSIVDVAVACGFVSASHFTECYRNFHGLSPNRMRRQGQQSVYLPSLPGARASSRSHANETAPAS